MIKNTPVVPDQITSNNDRLNNSTSEMIIDPKSSIYHVPSFLVKLFEIVESKESDNVIAWTKEGDGFCIK